MIQLSAYSHANRQGLHLTAGQTEIVDLAQIPAAENARPPAPVMTTRLTAPVIAPCIKLFAQCAHHDEGHGIERLGTVEVTTPALPRRSNRISGSEFMASG